jgi:SAM-dependent methyltransferase
VPESINEIKGRALFGADPRSYDAVRPPYPEPIYTFLQATGALRFNVSTLELGAGSGLATRRLLELGANPLTALEPDRRFAPLLKSIADAHAATFRLLAEPFEEADLPPGHFDLVVAATSYHWLQPSVRVVKSAQILKRGGYLALWWNVFGDPEREDPFHEATKGILAELPKSPSDGRSNVPFALDVAARRKELMDTGAFSDLHEEMYRWTLHLNAQQVGALYATFSPISQLSTERRRTVLAHLVEIAEGDFAGVVSRNMVSPIYVARRKLDGP